MWLPFTMRILSGLLSPITEPRTWLTHGPPVLMRHLALISLLPPLFISSRVHVQLPPSRRADTQRVRGLMSAPRSAASRALSTTRRASSTQQSEYSKPRVKSGLSGVPVISLVRSTLRVAGRILRPPAGVAGKTRAIDAAANNGEVIDARFVRHASPIECDSL